MCHVIILHYKPRKITSEPKFHKGWNVLWHRDTGDSRRSLFILQASAQMLINLGQERPGSEYNPPTALLYRLNLLWHSTVSSQTYGGTASLFFHTQTLALSVQDRYQRLRSGWISPAWEQIVSQVCQDCGRRNKREIGNNFGRGKSVTHNPAQLITLCLWAHRDRRTVMLAQIKALTGLILFRQWSATDAERRVKKESRQVLVLLLNILPTSGLPKSKVFTLSFIVFD